MNMVCWLKIRFKVNFQIISRFCLFLISLKMKSHLHSSPNKVKRLTDVLSCRNALFILVFDK